MDTPPCPEQGEFLRVVSGSTLHGCSLDDSADLDLMGVAIPPPGKVIGLSAPWEQSVYRTQPKGVPSGPGDVDCTIYSLTKYLRLVANGNPSLIALLFAPKEYRHIDGIVADELRALIPSIISKECGARYLGYAKAQKERLLGERGQKRTGATRRLKYESEPDANGEVYDKKYLYHILRLLMQGQELMTEGWIELPIDGYSREALIAVRRGAYTLAEGIEWADRMESQLKGYIDASKLPDHPDRERLNEWLVGAYLRHYESPRPVRLLQDYLR